MHSELNSKHKTKYDRPNTDKTNTTRPKTKTPLISM